MIEVTQISCLPVGDFRSIYNTASPYLHSDLERRLLATVGILVGAEIVRARLETENSELTNRLETRKLVDKAKGILQRDLSSSEDEAYHTMQRESRQRRRSDA